MRIKKSVIRTQSVAGHKKMIKKHKKSWLGSRSKGNKAKLTREMNSQ